MIRPVPTERMTMVDVQAYLARIAYEGPRDPSARTLRELHRAHLFAVPFENLDIHLGRPIVLDEASLVRKIVEDRRGGFCYELNGAFAALLEAMGFGVARLAAGVMGDGGFGPAFDHMLLEVTAAGDPKPWLVDVGFGEGFLEPIRVDLDAEHVQANGTYRLEGGAADGNLTLARRIASDSAFEPRYRFTRVAHGLAEYEAMCRFHQTSPESHFTRQRVCSLAAADGRITLGERAMIVTTHGRRTVRRVHDDAAYRAALQEHFGIVLDAPWVSPLDGR